MGNSRTQSRLRNATQQDQIMNKVVSVAELVKVNEIQMYRNNSLSNIKEGHKSPRKIQYATLDNKFVSRNQIKTSQNSQIELFEKFYQTVKPTDDKTFKKIISFTLGLDTKPETTTITQTSIFTRKQFDQTIQKLGYEWKNIYRLLTLFDSDSTGEVTFSQFEKACIKQKVSLSDYETKKLY
jgi:hypothetical protein